jgi:hypothetical protein
VAEKGSVQLEAALPSSPSEWCSKRGGRRGGENEGFKGLLVPLMARSLGRHTLPAFQRWTPR